MTTPIKQGVIYARVSSREQEREGFSIPAQLKLLREYCLKHQIKIVREFVDIETAKNPGRKEFGEMVRFFEKHPQCRVVIVEKTDRLYRNFRDSVTLEDLGVEIHLPKEGHVLNKDSKSQVKLMHGFQVLIARNYIENLREEVKKGMKEKASQGIYPGRAAFGYRNNKIDHTIEVHPENAAVVKRIFELYAEGNCSLSDVRKIIRTETGKSIAKSHIHDGILRNPFYIGYFTWDGEQHKGTQPAIISPTLFQRVQDVLDGHNKPKYHKHDFPFGGLLSCAYDDCMVTAEFKKNKYTYYRCTGYRGKCDLPRMREAELGQRLVEVLKNIHIPDDVMTDIENKLTQAHVNGENKKKEQRQKLEQRLAAIRKRMDQMYIDKLDGKVSEEFWQRKTAEWQLEEQQVMMAIQGLEQASPDVLLNAKRILELANKAYFLYVTQNPAEQGQLLKKVLLNCRIDGASLYPTYRKPFDLIFERAKTKEWSGREDLNLRPPGPEPDSRVFEFLGERERGKFSVFKGLQRPLSAQIQGN
ncbi:MAG TPA: recombinase family protein [Candidatus Angelobacter sp.]|nr:recombinase family protein [Candidatus Angelobacter sp.]